MTLSIIPALPAQARAARSPIDRSLLLAFADQRIGKSVDCDMGGNAITDVKVLLWGAMGPAVMRLVNLVVDTYPEGPPLERAQLHELAVRAYGQVTDMDFANQPITDYRILFEYSYGYGTQVEQLVELARQHAPVLRTRPIASKSLT